MCLRIFRSSRYPATKKEKTGGDLQIEDLEIVENLAYIMTYHADPSIPEQIDDWLEVFEIFSMNGIPRKVGFSKKRY